MYSVIGGDGQVYGPVDLQTLQRWCAEGRIGPNSYLIDPATGQQILAGSAPGLAGYFAVQSVPQPTPMMPPTTPYAPRSNYYRNYPAVFGQSRSPKSKATALWLALFLGFCGVHRFYLGHIGSGLAMLLLSFVACGNGGLIVTGIWALVDALRIATDSLTDATGQKLS